MLERDLEAYFRREIKARQGWAIKLTGIKGLPDRMVLLPGGRLYFVELKTERGRLAPIQKAVHYKLLGLGFMVHVLYGRQSVDEFLGDI
jgi:hypothetical protein